MRFLLLIIFSGICLAGFGQPVKTGGACRISGRIVDSLTRTPIEFATITAFLAGSSNVAGGMITDDKGQFVIDLPGPGEYLVKIDFMGRNTVTKRGIVLSDRHPVVKLGDLLIADSSHVLTDFTVSGSRSYVENKLDKLVYNVGNDISGQTGNATEILKKVPQISVDINGNVELLGNSNVRVFINGKPSAMFDNNLAEALQSIPASEIKSIEVITTPGAQYDAQGTGGIINIILKSDKSQGINGNINLSAGTRLENGTASLHAHKGKFDFNASAGSNDQLKGTTLLSMNRKSNSDSVELTQNGNGTDERNSYKGQVSVDYALSAMETLSCFLKYNNYGGNTTGLVSQVEEDFYPVTDTSTVRNASSYFRYRVVDYNINYLKKIDTQGRELNVSYQSSYCRYNSFYNQFQQYVDSGNAFTGGQGNNRLRDYETYLVADYTHPFTKNIVLNTGIKGSFTREYSYSDHYLLNTFTRDYDFDPYGQNEFNYLRDVYAAYISLTFPLGEQNSLKLGMRDEYTNINLPIDTTNPSYNSFIPSVVVSRKLGKTQNIKASYTKRIQRANYQTLNPYIDATDPSNLLQGNPYLRPERSDVAELSYFRFFEGGSSLLATLYYRNTRDDEQSYILHEDSLRAGNTVYDNVTITTNENAGHQQITGLNVSGSLTLNKKLEVRGSGNVFERYIVSTLVPGNSISALNYRINGNATYKFNDKLVAECFANFNSPHTEIQGKFPSFTSYSFAIRQMLWDKKGSIAFTTTNPFNNYVNQVTDITGTNFSVYSDREVPYRSFGLNFTWKFGKIEYKEKKTEHSETEDERNPGG